MNPDLIKQFVLQAVRWLAAPAVAWIAVKFGITEDQTTIFIVGGVTYLIMFIWGLANKSRYEEKVNTALDMHKGADKADLKEVIATGNGTSATVKK
jgi:hypothetical protein